MSRGVPERSVAAATDTAAKAVQLGRRLMARRPAGGWVAAALIILVIIIGLRLTVFGPPVVLVAEIGRGDLAAEVEGTGTVAADAVADIASKITGRVERVFVDEGDSVKEGETVATLDQTDLHHQFEASRARLAAARVTAEERQREWNRELGLVKTGAASVEDSQQYQERLAVAQSALRATQAESQAAEYNLSLTRIPSLLSGIVTKRWVVPGASVVPGQALVAVADTSLIYVNTYIDQNFTGKLKKGEGATVILRGRENQPLAGRVLRISPQADAATEETVAEVAFTLPREEFQLGQWANVYLEVGETKQALIVPRPALMQMDNRTFVFVVDPADVVHREPVTVLAESPRRPMVAVAGHLKPHDRVVLMPMGLAAGETVRPRPAQNMPSGPMP